MGFDQPRSLGGYAQGGTFAAPIFKQFVTQTRARWDHTPFTAPSDIRLVKIDRASGKRVFEGEPTADPRSSIIWEAFKADTEPPRATRQDQLAAQRDAVLAAIRKLRSAQSGSGEGGGGEEAGADFVEQQGGVY
jgi:penicillin-binding protein 1A